MNKPVVIVGGGIFGITVASVLQEAGHRVIIYDRGEPLAGTKPSGGLMKPSWLDILSKKEIDASFALLDHHFGVNEIEFTVLPTNKTVKLYRINMRRVFTKIPIHVGYVKKVEPGRVWITGHKDAPETNWHEICGCIVVVAAGYWSKELLNLPDMKAKKGVAYTVQSEPGNFFKLWAPYKQAIICGNGDGSSWVGDGTAIKPDNWTQTYHDKVWERVSTEFSLAGVTKVGRVGIRPILAEGYRQITPDLFLCTGAGKNGSALAGVYAQKILEAIS